MGLTNGGYLSGFRKVIECIARDLSLSFFWDERILSQKLLSVSLSFVVTGLETIYYSLWSLYTPSTWSHRNKLSLNYPNWIVTMVFC